MELTPARVQFTTPVLQRIENPLGADPAVLPSDATITVRPQGDPDPAICYRAPEGVLTWANPFTTAGGRPVPNEDEDGALFFEPGDYDVTVELGEGLGAISYSFVWPAASGADLRTVADQLPPLLKHRMTDADDEPGPVVVWTLDDGYGTWVDFMALADARDIKTTLFVTPAFIDLAGTSPTWGGDTYLTSAQLQAMANAGHELAVHGYQHNAYTSTLDSLGPDGLDEYLGDAIEFLEAFAGAGAVRTGAYPGGASSLRVQEVVGRRAAFYRGIQQFATPVNEYGSPAPFNSSSINAQDDTEANLKGAIDYAIANRQIVCFYVHGGFSPAQLTKFANLMDYAIGLGVPHKTYFDAMYERLVLRQGRGSVDTHGNLFAPVLRGFELRLNREDSTAGHWGLTLDERYNRVQQIGDAGFDIDGVRTRIVGGNGNGIPSPSNKGAAARVNLSDSTYNTPQVAIQTTYGTQVTDGATTDGSDVVTSATAAFLASDVGYNIHGTAGIPAGSRIVERISATQVRIDKPCTATAAGVTVTFGRTAVTSEDQIIFTRRHIIATGNAPSASVGSSPAAGSGASASVAGKDTAGTITVTTGPTPGTGRLCFLAAAVGFTAAPRVALTPKNAAAALAMAAGLWAQTGANNPLLELMCQVAPPASTAMIFDYVLIQS